MIRESSEIPYCFEALIKQKYIYYQNSLDYPFFQFYNKDQEHTQILKTLTQPDEWQVELLLLRRCLNISHYKAGRKEFETQYFLS